MSSGNIPPGYNPNYLATPNGTAQAPPPGGYYQRNDFAPPPALSATVPVRSSKVMAGSQPAAQTKGSKFQSTSKGGIQKLSKSKSSSSSGSKASGGSSSSGNKSSSKGGVSSSKSGTSSVSTSRQVPGNTTLEFNTPKQNQMLSQCDHIDRTIWATRVLWGGNAVNGFLRSTATAQRIKKQRARQNNSTKMSRAAKAASASGAALNSATGDDNKKGATGTGPVGMSNAKSGISGGGGTSASKSKEVFNQQEEELLKKEIMNPRTAKKLKGELEAGLTFCATVCNVLRGVLFDIDPSLSPSLPPHLNLQHEKPPPAHTFLIPSPPPPGSQLQRSTGIGTGSKVTKGSSKSKGANAASAKAGSNKNSALSKQQLQQSAATPTTKTSPGDPGSSTLRRFRKTSKKNKIQSIANEPGFVNLPPEVDAANGNKRTCTKKEYQHRVFQLLRYRDLKQGDYCAARLSSRDWWILAKVLKDYKTTSLAPIYTSSPIEFLSMSDTRRDMLFQKARVLLKDAEDQQSHTPGTQVVRSLVLPLPRSPAEANEWASKLIKKGSRVYAMYPETTVLYAATVIDSTTYCRGDDDIIVVQFDEEEADLMTGKFPSYHIPARFVTLIPRESPASQAGRSAGNGTKSNTSAVASSLSGSKREASSASAGSTNKRKSSASNESAASIYGLFKDACGDLGEGGFDDLDLDFEKPLDEHEEGDQGFNPFG
mmetsp:Transcript_23687/g.65755  ORF Transcript_23687/g.65755 Transcript_23687/m.65755 type:complete len:710 (+) Transcript_23687:120-2249(+)